MFIFQSTWSQHPGQSPAGLFHSTGWPTGPKWETEGTRHLCGAEEHREHLLVLSSDTGTHTLAEGDIDGVFFWQKWIVTYTHTHTHTHTHTNKHKQTQTHTHTHAHTPVLVSSPRVQRVFTQLSTSTDHRRISEWHKHVYVYCTCTVQGTYWIYV